MKKITTKIKTTKRKPNGANNMAKKMEQLVFQLLEGQVFLQQNWALMQEQIAASSARTDASNDHIAATNDRIEATNQRISELEKDNNQLFQEIMTELRFWRTVIENLPEATREKVGFPGEK